VVNIDINNIKSCKLKEDELDDYLELLKKKLIDISEERK